MKENTDPNKLAPELSFTLEVRIPDQSPKRIFVLDRILAGIDPRNDLILVAPRIKAKHFLFIKRDNILTVHYMGATGDTFLNGLPLEKGKYYILEKGDALKVGKIEILVRRETLLNRPIGQLPPTKADFTETKALKIDDFIAAETSPVVETKKNKKIKFKSPLKLSAHARKPFFDFRTITLILYKFYGFLIDVALTYFLLSFLLPVQGLMSQAQNHLSPLTLFFTQYINIQFPNFETVRFISLFEFFVIFHLLMLATSLILGSTPGALLVGIRTSGKNNFFIRRFKAYIYALINIAALPLLIFDVPFYKGKNIKEILTFSTHELNSSLIFKISRRAVLPLLLLASLLSPFFLPPPFTANFTRIDIKKPKFVDPHTIPISSYSPELGLSMSSDLNKDFILMPSFEKRKLGLALYDLKNKNTLIMKEEGRTDLALMTYKLRYANPFASTTLDKSVLENEALKNKTVKSMELSLTNLFPGLSEFGLLMANGFLFKENFLKNFSTQDQFIYMPFGVKNPAIKISSGTKALSSERVFLFTRKNVIEFSLNIPKLGRAIEVLGASILAPMRFDQSSNNGLKDPQILEVLDAFERSNYQTLLTYYINEAKKADESHNEEWKAIIKKNLEQTKRALFDDETRTGLTKTIEKSFDDVRDLLKENGKK